MSRDTNAAAARGRLRPSASVRLAALAGVCAAALVLSAPAGASSRYRASAPTPPQLLPAADAHTASVQGRWLVGAANGAAARRIGARHGARALLQSGRVDGLVAFSVPAAGARALADDLKAHGLLRYSEPDGRARRASTRPRAFAASLPRDPLSAFQWWPGQIIAAGMTPPAVTPDTPWLAVIDSQLDVTHPEAAAGNLTAADPGPVTDEHGTAVAATAAAPANGVGIVGLWPGLPTRVYNSGDYCGQVSDAIDRATADGAAAINMSFGFDYPCYTLYLAVTGSAGSAVMVASGGNEFEEGNNPIWPASWPHVMTVAAVDSQLGSSYFSNENNGIDIAAPGQDIFTAVPLAYDTEDGVADGYTLVDGTSFSAPLTAAAAAWTVALRPQLSPDGIIWALTYAARDLGERGWDQAFGWGLLQISSDLWSAHPPTDGVEPNDDMMFVDGRLFGAQDAPALRLRGRRRDSLRGRLDVWEDPSDVYWLNVPGHSRFSISLTGLGTDADLFAYRSSASSIQTRSGGVRRRGLIASSTRSGRKRDAVYIINRGGATRAAVAVRIFPEGRMLATGYRLSARRYRR